jgi:hypothetical protein
MKRKWIVLAPLAILAVLLFVALGGAAVRALWNWLLPALFGWPRITFWQALGLLALCRILFGGLGGPGGGRRSNLGRRVSERWDQRVAERLEHMTPEERERFRQRMRERRGLDPSRPEPARGTSSE